MSDSNAEHPLILVASPQVDIRQIVGSSLAETHYQVAFAEAAANTLLLSGSLKPRLVIVDGQYGTSLIGQLKLQYHPAPLVLAVVDSAASLDDLLAAGADDTISLPIHTLTLLQRIKLLVAAGSSETYHQQPEISLQADSQLFRALFKYSPDAVLILEDKTIVDCNDIFCQMNGYSRDELIGQSIDSLNYFEDEPVFPDVNEYMHKLRTLGHLQYEAAHRRKNGTIFPIEVSSCLINVRGRELILGIDRDITERKRAEAALKANEERYRLLTEYTTDLITRHNIDGFIQFASPASESLLGYKPEEMVGRLAYDFVHPADREQLIARHKNLPKGLEKLTDTYRVLRKDGMITWFETTSRRLFNPETNMIEDVVSVSRDISDRMAIEVAEREQHVLIQALGDAAVVLKSTLKTDEALDGILEQAARVVPYDSASITLVEGDTARIVRCRGFNERGVEEYVRSLRFSIREHADFFHQLLQDKVPRIIDDVHSYSDWVTSPETDWIHSNVTVPVIVQDRVIALLHLDSTAVGAFNADQAARLQTFADQVAIAIQSAQLYDELRALYHATSFLFTSFDADDISDLAKQITQMVVLEFGKIDCGIFLLEPDDGRLPLLARAGDYLVHSHTQLYLSGPGLIAEALRTGGTIYAPDVRLDSRYLMADERTRSEMIIPLLSRGKLIGVLDLQSPEIAAFTPQDQRVLEAFAERSAEAIQNLQYAHELELRVVERTAELRQTKEQVEAILNNSSDAIVVTYIDSTIRRVNPAFSALFGYPLGEGVGQPLASLVASYDLEVVETSLEAAIMDSRASRVEIALRRKDGSLFDGDVVISPILEREEHSLGMVFTVRDITERKRMEMELRKALAQERELSELKSRFVSMASHEFRTPLTMIMTASELLQNYSHRMTDEQKAERLDRIKTEVKTMANLIDDVLVVNKSVEEAALEFDPMPLNLNDFGKHLLNEIRITDSENHHFELVITGQYVDVYLDQKFLRDILNNLLWNAVKYSAPHTEIKLTLICGLEQTVMMVEDHGIGIPEEDQKRLFEAFHRGKNVGAISGTGLGLAIAKQAVELHGGTITFNSQLGVGTTFTVMIPAVLVEDSTYDH
jgi:PAS domain S-box-containing protein